MEKGLLPDRITQCLEMEFSFPGEFVFTQVATRIIEGTNIRTMRLFGLEPKKGLVLMCHGLSHKCQELELQRILSLCILHPTQKIQIIIAGMSEMMQYEDDASFFDKYWRILPKDIQEFYHLYVPEKMTQPIKNPAEHFKHYARMLMVRPHQCEYMYLDKQYQNSKRYRYQKNNKGMWQKSTLPVLL